MLFGLAGLLLGGAAFYHSFRVQTRQRDSDEIVRHDGEVIETLVDETTALRNAVAEANKRISSEAKALADGLNDVAALRKRVEALEAAAKDR
jgi:hypothetical protein